MTGRPPEPSRWRRPVLAGILLLTVLLGGRGLTDESSVMLGADMARYMMDGVFVRDFLADGGAASMEGVTQYAERYYARYPALSLGHHPPLPFLTLVPFYAVFGISVFAVRIAELCWFLLAACALYAIARRLYGWHAASWAALLFVTNPLILRNGQRLLSEMPMLATVLVSMALLLDYCDTRRLSRLMGFAVAVAASLYAKQLAVFMFPVYLTVLVSRLGWKVLIQRQMLWLIGAVALVVTPLAIMTIRFAPQNFGMAVQQVTRLLTAGRQMSVGRILTMTLSTHLTVPAMIITSAGAVAIGIRRMEVAIVVLVWVASCLTGTVIVAGGIEPARYAIGAMPAYMLMAGGLVGAAPARWWRILAAAAVAAVVVWQLWLIRDVRPTGAGGYEAAAEYVLAHAQAPVVLYDSTVDTGYFVFYVRKHDVARRLVLLRADKLLLREGERAGQDDRELTGSVYGALRKYGVQDIVAEERRDGPPVLRKLHDELSGGPFTERARIAIDTREPAIQGRDLVIYQYRNVPPADPDAELDIDVWLAARTIKLRMRDLLGPGAR